ncbi:nuclear transport factor 2 family protein [Bosea sp. TWI1241]|uniref:nuclear transport factor 2 family protein n=1 Tax=Bosea sp. TWI1241 TaxID=3148904 RepID=UPI00320AE411
MDDEDIRAIETATRTYLDGLYEGHTAKLASVFHPTSALTHLEGGEVSILPRAQWLERVGGRQSPQAAGLARADHILTIDLAAPGMALVKVKCQIPPRYFVDLLSFLKIGGRWQVVQKVFAVETRG